MATNERPLSEVRFLTVAEVATVMRVSKMTVYRLVHYGELPAVRVGRSLPRAGAGGPRLPARRVRRDGLIRPSASGPSAPATRRKVRAGLRVG